MRVDLHIHTTASDSRWTPAQVVEGVQALGIGLFAIADHDAVNHVELTASLAKQAGVAFLPGVEITTVADGHTFHILGYGIDPQASPMRTFLPQNRAKLEAEDDRNIQYLITQGYAIDFEHYLAYEYDRKRGGFKSINYLMDQGFCSDLRTYSQTIRANLPPISPDFASVPEAISAIRESGGIPILAHPGVSFHYNDGLDEAMLTQLQEFGIVGAECYSYAHDDETTAACVEWCTQHNLLITGGSDYHGGFAGRALGQPEVYTTDLHLGELESHIRRS